MSQTHAGPDNRATYRTPNWVKAFGIIALAVVVLVGIMLLSGIQHGPGMHMPSGGARANTPSTNLTQEPTSQHGMQHP
jgi:hypothetical protein